MHSLRARGGLWAPLASLYDTYPVGRRVTKVCSVPRLRHRVMTRPGTERLRGACRRICTALLYWHPVLVGNLTSILQARIKGSKALGKRSRLPGWGLAEPLPQTCGASTALQAGDAGGGEEGAAGMRLQRNPPPQAEPCARGAGR